MYLNQYNGFNSRSFYGETFSVNLLYMNDFLDKGTKKILLQAYENIDKSGLEFHWEFNNYALMHYYRISKDKQIRKYLYPLRFKGTSVTNWTLLRSNTRLFCDTDKNLAVREARSRINRFQLPSGLILDDRGVRSFQYHCFSMAMVAEIFDQTYDEYFLTSFMKGVGFIRNFILSNGETLYIGRGQNQSFGYGVLIYILALAYRYSKDNTILGDIEKVYNFLIQFQRDDGSFPLVMNTTERGIPQEVSVSDPNYPGWYPYNNYFDYLPFMGYFITKAVIVLKELDTSIVTHQVSRDYKDHDFIKIVMPAYEAVLSRPGGYWSNDLPVPFVVNNKRSITPCYGGEQFQRSMYGLKGIPLPYFELIKKSIRWRSLAFFKKNILWLISPLGIMVREYKFQTNEIIINTSVYSFLPYKHIYLFLEKMSHICKETDSMEFEGYQYSASGKLECYSLKGHSSKITIRMKNDQESI